jgi:hypothetical protein
MVLALTTYQADIRKHRSIFGRVWLGILQSLFEPLRIIVKLDKNNIICP